MVGAGPCTPLVTDVRSATLEMSRNVVSGRRYDSRMALAPLLAALLPAVPCAPLQDAPRTDGYRGIWYANQPSGDEYAYKYSGGLGTYCATHRPFAVHRPEVERTFFVYGGAPADGERELLHLVSYYDHRTGTGHGRRKRGWVPPRRCRR